MEKKQLIDEKLNAALKYEEEGKLLHASQLYNSILEESPFLEEVYYRLADVYDRLGSTEASVNLQKTFLHQNPDNKEMRMYLGQYLVRNAKWSDAIEILEYLMPSEEPVAFFLLGYSNFMLQDYKHAKINFESFISLQHDSELIHESYLYLAKILIQLKDYKTALNYTEKASVVYSGHWELHLVEGMIYHYMGMYAHAQKSIEKALKLNKNEGSIHEWAGKIYFKIGDYKNAEKHIRRFIDSGVNVSDEIYAILGQTCFKLGRIKEAQSYFELALAIKPENSLAAQGIQKVKSLMKNK